MRVIGRVCPKCQVVVDELHEVDYSLGLEDRTEWLCEVCIAALEDAYVPRGGGSEVWYLRLTGRIWRAPEPDAGGDVVAGVRR